MVIVTTVQKQQYVYVRVVYRSVFFRISMFVDLLLYQIIFMRLLHMRHDKVAEVW